MRDYYPGTNDQPEIDRVAQSPFADYQMPGQPADYAVLPTLRVNEAANRNDHTVYKSDLNLVDVYKESQSSIVLVKGDKQVEQNGRMVPGEVTGSGFFVTPDGKLATDYHVIKDASNLRITAADGSVYKATVEDVDPSTDLALLKVDNGNPLKFFPILPLGESQVSNGSQQAAIAMGHPHGWSDTFVSPGMLKSTRLLRDVLPEIRGGALPGENLDRLMQTYEMNVQSGNSGGPLIDRSGRVVGVIGLSNSKDTALATPVEDLLRLLNHSRKIGQPQGIPTAGSLDLDATRRFNQSLSGGYGAITTYKGDFPGTSNFGDRGTATLPTAVPGGFNQDAPPVKLPEKRDGKLPSDESRSGNEVPSVSHTLIHGVNAYTKMRALTAGRPGVAGGLFSVAAGGYDLVFNDFSQFRSSLNSGDTKQIFTSGLQLAADGLLIGGGAASLSTRFAVPGAIASLAGSGIKIVTDGIGYTKLRK